MFRKRAWPVIIVFLILASFPATSLASGTEYSFPEFGFSYTVPDGWQTFTSNADDVLISNGYVSMQNDGSSIVAICQDAWTASAQFEGYANRSDVDNSILSEADVLTMVNSYAPKEEYEENGAKVKYWSSDSPKITKRTYAGCEYYMATVTIQLSIDYSGDSAGASRSTFEQICAIRVYNGYFYMFLFRDAWTGGFA